MLCSTHKFGVVNWMGIMDLLKVNLVSRRPHIIDRSIFCFHLLLKLRTMKSQNSVFKTLNRSLMFVFWWGFWFCEVIACLSGSIFIKRLLSSVCSFDFLAWHLWGDLSCDLCIDLFIFQVPNRDNVRVKVGWFVILCFLLISRVWNVWSPLNMQDFYEDLFEELSKYGEIENLNICDNLADHMVGPLFWTLILLYWFALFWLPEWYCSSFCRLVMFMSSSERKIMLQVLFRILLEDFMQVSSTHFGWMMFILVWLF